MTMLQTLVRKAAEGSLVVGRELFARIYMLLTVASCGLGIVILLGQGERFSGPSLQGARELASILPFFPGWAYWGVFFLLHGFALISAWHQTWAVYVLRFGIVVSTFLAIGFVRSLFVQPSAEATGGIIYSAFAVIFLLSSDYLQHYGWGHGEP